MTVREHTGRTRYIAFRLVDARLPRPALAGALPPAARLTRFDGTYGILRTGHRERDAVLEALRAGLRVDGRDVRVETLVTSGTIRQAAQALPDDAPAARRGRRPSR